MPTDGFEMVSNWTVLPSYTFDDQRPVYGGKHRFASFFFGQIFQSFLLYFRIPSHCKAMRPLFPQFLHSNKPFHIRTITDSL